MTIMDIFHIRLLHLQANAMEEQEEGGFLHRANGEVGGVEV